MSAYDAQVLARSGLTSYIPLLEPAGVLPVDQFDGTRTISISEGTPTMGSTSLTADGETSAYFSGTDVFKTSTQIIPDLTAAWSLIFMVEFNYGSSNPIPLMLNEFPNPTDPARLAFLYYNGSGLRFYANTWDQVLGGTSNLYYNPTHIGITYDPATNNGTITAYVNGVLLGSYPNYLGNLYNTGSSSIGVSSADTPDYMTGNISKVAGYQRILSGPEFAADYAASQATGPTLSAYDEQVLNRANCTSFIPFNEASGTPVDAKDGTRIVSVAPSSNDPPTLGSTSLTSDGETSAYFDGNASYITSSQIIPDLTQDWSTHFMVEFNYGSGGPIPIILNQYINPINPGDVAFLIYDGTNISILADNFGVVFGAPAESLWYNPTHIGISYTAAENGGTVRVYINGQQLGAPAGGGAGNFNNGGNASQTSIAVDQTDSPNNYFTGNISKVAGYQRALSAGEFATDYRAATGASITWNETSTDTAVTPSDSAQVVALPPFVNATRVEILNAGCTSAANAYVAANGTGARSGYSIYVGYAGQWVVAPNETAFVPYTILSSVELSGLSASALAAALIAAKDDQQPETGPF
jgi:hypothetical protein